MFPLKTLSLLLTSCNGEEREGRRKKRLTDEHISKMAFRRHHWSPDTTTLKLAGLKIAALKA